MDDLIKCIGQRFSTFSIDPVLLAAEVFDPANLPGEELLEEFGDAELHQLCEYFEPLLLRNGCNLAEVEREWFKAKQEI